jgi:hypothetical protein
LRRFVLPIALAGLVGVVVAGGLLLRWISSPEDPGMVFVIPASAQVEVPTIDSAIDIPTNITFGSDETAVITVRNDDSIPQRAGPWVVGAGQTYTARFDEPGVYQFDCSVDDRESVTVTVLDENGEVPA